MTILTLRHSHLRGLRIYILIGRNLWLVVKILALRCLRNSLRISLIDWSLNLRLGLSLRLNLRLRMWLGMGLCFLWLSEAKRLSMSLYLWGWGTIELKDVNRCTRVGFRRINRWISLWCGLFNWLWLLPLSRLTQLTRNFFEGFLCFNYNIWLSLFLLLLSC